jgi:hypothetical protein
MTDKEKTSENWFSKQPTSIKYIIALIGMCCIGIIIISAIGSFVPDLMLSDNSTELKLYENEHISFKYSNSFRDVTTFYSYMNDEEYIFWTMFSDLRHDGMIVSCEEIDISLIPTYLDEYYDNVNTNGSQRNDVKNFTVEKIDFNGINAIKVTDEYYENDDGNYGIYLTFIYNKKNYNFYFRGNNISTLNSYYELLNSSLVLKQ